MKLMRRRLTKKFMCRIYSRLSINMDHIVVTALRFVPTQGIPEKQFKQVIYLACLQIKKKNHRRVHRSMRGSIINLVAEGHDVAYASIMKLATQEHIVLVKNGHLFVDQAHIKMPHPFHRMRLDNTTSVLANEFEVMKWAVKIIKNLVYCSAKKLLSQVSEAVIERDLSIYENERMRSYRKLESKSREVGRPQFIAGDKNKAAILLVHGFAASPGELSQLSVHLNQQGHSVYLVRLAGHGTHASELQNASLQCWIESVQRGYAVLSHSHSKVIMMGFSAGALLVLLQSATELAHLAAIVAINPALVLQQKSSQLSPLLNKWNHLLKGLSVEAGSLPYIKNDAQYEQTNYDKIYIEGLTCLLELQESCRETLNLVNAPLLVIQAENDPVVDPDSAQIIIDNVFSEHKRLEYISCEHHVIVRDEGSIETFELIDQFISTLR